MNGIIDWFTRNGVAANLLMFAIVGLGLHAAFEKIVFREFPDYPSRTISVSVSYRGSTPKEVEEGIVRRLEEALFDLEGLEEMDASAGSNGGRVNLLIEDGYDLGESLDEIKNRVDTIQSFPEEAERPRIQLSERQQRLITVVVTGALGERELKRIGEQIRDEITNLPGVTLANLKAVRPYEISIEVSESTLKEYGLTFDSIVRSVRTSSIDLSAGSIRSEGGNIMLRTSEQAYTQDEFEQIVVLTRRDGTRVTLGDVAIVNDGFEEVPIVSKYNGKRAVAIDVYRLGAQNALEMGEEIRAFLDNTRETLPEGVGISYWQDDSQRIEQRLSTLKNSAVMGFCLVIVVLSLFLRPSLAFWVSLGIPIAFAGAIFVLPLIGITINLITLFAFILVLGIVVDDAIVTGENVFQRMQAGEDSMTAAIKGTQDVAVPVIFGVLTTIAAFYPLTVMTGFRGSLFKQVPLVVIPVLLFSLVESKLILPAHLKHCRTIGSGKTKTNWLMRAQRRVASGLERIIDKVYRPVLERCLEFRYLTASVFIALLAIFIGLFIGDRISFTFFPSLPRDSVRITLIMPVGTAFEKTQTHIDAIEKTALQIKEDLKDRLGADVIETIFATAGGRPFSSWRGTSGVAEEGEVVIEIVPDEVSGVKFGSRDLVMELRRLVPPIPEAEQLNFAFARTTDSMSIQLVGPRVEDLTEISKALQRKLATYEGLYDIEDSFAQATDELELELKPQAVHLGVTAQNLALQVRQAFFGAEAQRIQRGRDDVRVMVRYPEEKRKSLATLHSMMIRTPEGIEVPFEEVAEVVQGKSMPSIRRVDRNRIIRVRAEADQESVNVDAIQEDLNTNFLPALVAKYQGARFSLEGRAAANRESTKQMLNGIAFVLVLVYVLLAIPFRSYFQPLIVMTAIPFGVVGAVIGHWIMSFISESMGRLNPAASLTMMSILGMLALSGVVVNDSLVMVDFINKKVKAGWSLPDAVRLAGVKRFRPILLTSLTTFAGLLPLMFDQSRQAQFLIPMAISLGWGVLFATFITLLFVPVTNLIFDDIRSLFCNLYNIDPAKRDADEESASDSPAPDRVANPEG